MGSVIKLVLLLYLLSLLFTMFVGLFTFIIDVFKWHDKEKKVNIVSSKENSIIKGGELSGRNTDYDNSPVTSGDNNNDSISVVEIGNHPLEF